MLILFGIWFAVAGGVAALAGITAKGRVERLRRTGRPAWALVVPSPIAAGDPADSGPRRTMIQFSLSDGRVIERLCPQPWRKAAAPVPGQRVPVWYDPADPGDVLVNGWDGRLPNQAFVAVGLIFILLGLAIAFGS
jgi:Protein of unknown function (DUF3592)